MSFHHLPGFMNIFVAGVIGSSALILACGSDREASEFPRTSVRVAVPENDNLQFMSFWIALGAGFFQDEGLDVELQVAPGPSAGRALLEGKADVVVLPPPMYLDLIGQQQPVLVFANLLQNDQINLVVRKEIAQARGLSTEVPLAERVKGLQGLRVGVAPGPPVRLRALFQSVGMDADRDIEIVVVLPAEQNRAFGEDRVDALYAHTPFLEKALVQQGAVLVINQSKGEVPELSGRQIHSLVTTRAVAEARPDVLVALARGLYRAQKLAHADQQAAFDALFASGVPDLEPALVSAILAIYVHAIPLTPEVSVSGVLQAHALFPASRTPPDLSQIDLTQYVAPQFAQRAIAKS